jgi:hypothetical protein
MGFAVSSDSVRFKLSQKCAAKAVVSIRCEGV